MATSDRPTELDDFLRGRDLACRMLDHASRAGSDTTAAGVRFRSGPQGRFAETYLAQLLAEPALLAGFSAVLSDALHEASVPGSLYADLSGEEMGVPH